MKTLECTEEFHFRILSNNDLIELLHKSVEDERKITVHVIRLLREVDDRRLFLKMGYGSLLDFCVKELKYSESSAYRRISAMRLSSDLPQIESKIVEGSLSLSVISQAQTFIRREEKTYQERLGPQEKQEIVMELENKSLREAEKLLVERNPEFKISERVRPLTTDLNEVRLALKDETIKKLDQIRALISHKNPNPSIADLIEFMAELTLQKLDPARTPKKGESSIKAGKDNGRRAAAPTRLNGAQMRRKIPPSIKREVWYRSKGQCCYVDIVSMRRCESRFQLQIDHIKPLALGGDHSLENLQLLCRAHNQMKGYEMPAETIGRSVIEE